MGVSTSEPRGVRALVLIASFALGAVGLYWIVDAFVVDGALRLGNPVDGPTATPQPRQVRAEVTRAEGVKLRVGDECVFLVERHELPEAQFQCRAQVVCGGVLLYGGPRRGYFGCALTESPRREVIGFDAATTGSDGDASLLLDTVRGILRVRDDAEGTHGAFLVEAEVLDVR